MTMEEIRKGFELLGLKENESIPYYSANDYAKQFKPVSILEDIDIRYSTTSNVILETKRK